MQFCLEKFGFGFEKRGSLVRGNDISGIRCLNPFPKIFHSFGGGSNKRDSDEGGLTVCRSYNVGMDQKNRLMRTQSIDRVF